MKFCYGILRNARWLKRQLWHLLVLVVPGTFPYVTAASTVRTSTCGRLRVKTDMCVLLMCVCVPSREVSPVSALSCFLFFRLMATSLASSVLFVVLLPLNPEGKANLLAVHLHYKPHWSCKWLLQKSVSVRMWLPTFFLLPYYKPLFIYPWIM
jgi:hypothetical protein